VSDDSKVTVTLPADVQQLDATGYAWAFLDAAAEPERVRPGALIVAGDADEPFLARVIDIVEVRAAARSCTSTSSASPIRPSTSCATLVCCRSSGPRHPSRCVAEIGLGAHR